MLVVIETHPVQYHAPVYRTVQADFGIATSVIYGSDFSVTGYVDREFNASFAWDTDLLSGYKSLFLSRVAEQGLHSCAEVSAKGLRQALHRLNPSAILLLGYSPRFYRQSCIEAIRSRKPILFRAETTDHARSRSKLESWIRDRLLCVFYRRCARLLYVGRRSRDHFRRLGVPEIKLISSPYCVDAAGFQLGAANRERLRAETRAQLQIAPTDRVIIFSGKLSPRKGPDLLLKAIKSLPDEIRTNLTVVFLGDGELRDALQSFAEATPRTNIRCVGFQNQTQLSRYYHAADVLILPSIRSETWGLVVNDALHHGLPCVVSEAVGCAPDLVLPGVTGEVFSTGSVADLAAAITRAMKLLGRPDVQHACRTRAEEYSVRRAAEGIANACQSVFRLGASNPKPLVSACLNS